MQNFLVNPNHEVNTGPAISIGDDVLDKAMSGGIRRGELWVVAVSNSNMKHDWATQVARHVARAGNGIALSLPEKDRKYIFELIHSEISGIPAKRIRPGLSTEDYNQLMDTVDITGGLPIVVNDAYTRSIPELEAKLKKVLIEGQVCCLVADFIQPLTGNPEGRADEILECVREFKQIAKSNNIGVIIFAQSKLEDSEESMITQLGSLCIENGADLVAALSEGDYISTNGVN